MFSEAPKPYDQESELGRSGTQSFYGIVTEDFNQNFHGQRAVVIYNKMRRSDGTINATLSALKLPIQSAACTIESADNDDDTQNEIADFVRRNLFEYLDGGFNNFIRESLNCLDFGFYYFEKVHKIVDGEVRLHRLAPRIPSAHWLWSMPSQPTVPGITQMLKSSDPTLNTMTPEIPMSKLVLFVNNQEGDNREGVSVLRSAYKHWFMRDTLYRIDGIKHERGAGVLKITLPDGASQTDKDRAEELGSNFKIGEATYIVVPNEKWLIELMTTGIADQSTALMESVKHHSREIVLNILAQFLDLGSGAGGSFALSKDQTSFFGLALRAIAQNIENTINNQIIKELVDLNYGPQDEYPKLCFAEIGEIDYAEVSTMVKTLVDAGLLDKDPDVKVWVRKTFGLPEATVEDFEDDDEADPVVPAVPVEPPQGEPPVEPPMPEVEDDMKAELAERKFFRPLTFAEQRVKFADVEDFFDKIDGGLSEYLKDLSALQKKQLMAKVERILDDQDIAGVADLALTGNAELMAKLKDQAKIALEEGKKTAAREVGAAIPVTTGFTKKVIEAKIALALKVRTSALEDAVKARLVDLMNNDVGKAASMFELQTILDKAASAQDNRLVGKIGIDFFDEGRALTFEDMKEDLHGLQRSEILDDKTCFPKGTKVATNTGERDISEIVKGDMVMTRGGLKRVVGVMAREYSGPMVSIEAGERGFSCTSEHPVWANGKWVEARTLKIGDELLQFATDVSGKVSDAVYDGFRESKDGESKRGEITVLPGVPRLVAVPVSSVRLYADTKVWQEEIDGISAHPGLLDEWNAERTESHPHLSLDSGLHARTPITRERAELPVSIAGNGSKSYKAGLASDDLGGTTAGFGTRLPASEFSIEDLSASHAWRIGDPGSLAFEGTEVEPGGIGLRNGESPGAPNTDLGDPLSEVSAGHRAEFGRPTHSDGRATTDTLELFHTILVYNIEVENQHEYMAESLLVHNCDMCMTLDGQTLSANDPFTKIGQIHGGCRGLWVGVLKTDAELPVVKALPKSLKNKFETIEGVPTTDKFKQLDKPVVKKGSRLERKIKDGDVNV